MSEDKVSYSEIARLEKELGIGEEYISEIWKSLEDPDPVKSPKDSLICACHGCKNVVVPENSYPLPWLQDRCRTCQNYECSYRVCQATYRNSSKWPFT